MDNKGFFVDMSVFAQCYRRADECCAMLRGMQDVLYHPVNYGRSDRTHDRSILRSVRQLEPEEFNALVGGEGLCAELNVPDWEAHTQCIRSDGCALTEEDLLLMVAFFRMLDSMRQEERRLLLRFWTGLHSLPFGGFKTLGRRLQLIFYHAPRPRAARGRDLPGAVELEMNLTAGRWPVAHTCVMSLRLPGSIGRIQNSSVMDCVLRDMFAVAFLHWRMEDD